MLAVSGTKENRCASVSSSSEELEFTPPNVGAATHFLELLNGEHTLDLSVNGVHIITRSSLFSVPQIYQQRSSYSI